VFDAVVGSDLDHGVAITGLQYLQVVRYREGDFFVEHCDDFVTAAPISFRKLIMSVQLVDEGDFRGGDFVAQDRPVRMRKGTAVLLRANVPHEIKKVISGTRVVLIGAFTGPRWV